MSAVKPLNLGFFCLTSLDANTPTQLRKYAYDATRGSGCNQESRVDFRMLLRNDATAAISISSMEGLLRRVRHIELRARYIPGLENPSDGLTKSFKTRDMPINLEREVGLVYGLDTNSFLWVKSFLIEFCTLDSTRLCRQFAS